MMYKCVFCCTASVGEEGMGSVERVGRGCEGECGGGWERMKGVWRGLGEDERESVEGVGRGCEGECGGVGRG